MAVPMETNTFVKESSQEKVIDQFNVGKSWTQFSSKLHPLFVSIYTGWVTGWYYNGRNLCRDVCNAKVGEGHVWTKKKKKKKGGGGGDSVPQ